MNESRETYDRLDTDYFILYGRPSKRTEGVPFIKTQRRPIQSTIDLKTSWPPDNRKNSMTMCCSDPSFVTGTICRNYQKKGLSETGPD